MKKEYDEGSGMMMDDDRRKKDVVELTAEHLAAMDAGRLGRFCVVADNIRSLHNVGAIFRTADSLGYGCVYLCGITGTPPSAELSKTALGAEESVRWVYYADSFSLCRELQARGWKIVVLEQAYGSVRLEDLSVEGDESVALVAGNEVTGVDERIVKMADSVVEIGQYGMKHSMNVSVATGIAMWWLSVGRK